MKPSTPGPTATTLPVGAGSLSATNYVFLQKYIYAESGILIEADKQYLLEARLLPILAKSQLSSLNALCNRLASGSPALGDMVIDAMTTNETLFFRDPAMFEVLRKQIIPTALDRLRGSRKLRIWSAASSSGQEAYSLAMTMLECGWTKAEIEIIGTDISQQVLDRATQGRYLRFEVSRGLPPAYLQRYFAQINADFYLHQQVRDLVTFRRLDLRRDLQALGSFDLVLCRNVLIYFDSETKRKILDGVRRVMYPEGTLVLGCAETLINIHDGFKRRQLGGSIFYSI